MEGAVQAGERAAREVSRTAAIGHLHERPKQTSFI